MDLQTISDTAAAYAVRVAGAIVLLVVAWFGSRWVSRLVARGSERAGVEPTVARFTGSLVRYGILIPAVPACLSLLGVHTTSFAAVIGAAGLAIALAFQGSLANFAAGFMLMVFGPFKVGDEITVAGRTGTVFQIALFATTLDTPDNRRVVVPNNQVFGSVIENRSQHDLRRVDIPVSVDRRVELDRARDVLRAAATTVPGTVSEPAAEILLEDFSSSAVTWEVRVWTRTADYATARESALQAVKLAADGLTV